MTHKNAPHHLRGDAKEMRPILPVHVMLINETQVNLVHQGGWLQRVSLAFPAEEADGLSMQLFVDQRKQSTRARERRPASRDQPLCYLSFIWSQGLLLEARESSGKDFTGTTMCASPFMTQPL